MNHPDHEIEMARSELYSIAKYAMALHEMLENVSELEGMEGWQQSKITKAADYMESVYQSLSHEMKFNEAAPKGWEGTVKAMKKHKEIDNPWALAHYMKNKGYKSHKKEEGVAEGDYPNDPFREIHSQGQQAGIAGKPNNNPYGEPGDSKEASYWDDGYELGLQIRRKRTGVAEGYQLDEGAVETITALVKKIPGIGKYYQMAQQYKPQLIEILKTSKSGKEVKQKMEQLAASQSATVSESGMTKQLGGLAVGGGSILSTMWMNAMGMIDGVLAHAAAGEVGGAVASGSILGLIPVTLMLFAAMLMFKGSKQSSDEKAQAFQAQRGQQGMAEAGYGRNKGYAPGFASPTAPPLRPVGGPKQDDEYVNGGPVNNIEVSINDRPWKIFPGKGPDGSKAFFQQKQDVDEMCKRKTAATGKKWSWGVTGEPATNESVEENKKGVRAVKHTTKPRNPVMAGDKPGKATVTHKNKKKDAERGIEKHKGKEPAYESRLWNALSQHLEK
jgi:hypothetical protein